MEMYVIQTIVGTLIESFIVLFVMASLLGLKPQRRGLFMAFALFWSVMVIGVNINISGYAPFINFSVLLFGLSWVLQEAFFKVFFTFIVFALLMILVQLPLVPLQMVIGDSLGALLIVLSLVVVIFALVLYKWQNHLKRYIQKYESKHFNYLALNVLVFAFLFKIIYDFDQSILLDNFPFFVFLMATMIGIHYFIYKEVAHISERNKLLEVQDEIRFPLEQAIESIKMKQHEYKNHLNSILGMLKTKSSEDATNQIVDFLSELKNFDAMEDEFIHVDRDVVKAIVFMKYSEAQTKGIQFKMFYKTALRGSQMLDYEMSIVLNNLLNNAFEAVEKRIDKNVVLTIDYDELNGKYIIETKNTGSGIEPAHLIKFGEKKYSTKETLGGFGLWNVNQIAKKYKGALTVSLESVEQSEDNQLLVRFSFE